MALANKERMPSDSTMAKLIQASAFYEQNFGVIQTSPNSSKEIYQEPESPEKSCGSLLVKNFTMSNSSSVSSPSSINSSGLGYQATPNNYNMSEEGHSLINFKPDYVNFSGSLLSFEQTKKVRRNLYPELMGNHEDEFPVWGDYHSSKCTAAIINHGLPETSSSHHVATGFGGGPQFGWLNDQEGNIIDGVDQEIGRQEASNNKRPSTGESSQVLKKQCAIPSSTSPSKKAKPSCSVSPSKDPQSIAAKNRRERISERLKVLQDLVPNGSKVDLVTMLEKAIGYVKFLQLQVKVLATDEFWPAPGGKAPDLSQVKDTIDAILASQRDTNSSSK